MENNEPYREIRSPHDILSFIDDYKISIDCFKKSKMIARGGLFNVYIYTEKTTNKQIVAKFVSSIKKIKKIFYQRIANSILVSCHPCFNKFIGFDIIKGRCAIF